MAALRRGGTAGGSRLPDVRRKTKLLANVNFLLHRHLARTLHGSVIAGVGAMLPDLWRMADRRVRTAPPEMARELAGEADDVTHHVLLGIEHHLESDLWFHDAPVFLDGERATREALKSAATKAKKLTLFAHPLWEMCLDGALVRRAGSATAQREIAEGFAISKRALRTAAHVHHFHHVTMSGVAEFEENLHAILDALSTGQWIAGYAAPEGLVRALTGMRRRFGLPPFAEDERARLVDAIATLAPLADTAVDSILDRF